MSDRADGRRSPGFSRDFISMVEDRSDDAGVGDEGEGLHLAAALVGGQGVELVNAIDELGPSFVGGSSRRIRPGFVSRGSVLSEVSSYAIA